MTTKQRVYLTAEAVEAARQNPGFSVLLGEGRYVSQSYLPRLVAQIEEMDDGFEIGWSVEATHRHVNPVSGRISYTRLGRVYLRWTKKAAAS